MSEQASTSDGRGTVGTPPLPPDRVLLHVGVPKTGTTTLQFHVLPRLHGVTYLGKPYDRPDATIEANDAIDRLVRSVWTTTVAEYDHRAAAELLRRGLDGRAGVLEGGTVVLSEEALTQASGGDRLEKARRLRRLLGRCRVLVTIREQRAALVSGHRWLLARRLVDVGFDRWIADCRAYSHVLGRPDDFPLRQYRYDEVIDGYRRLFGRERVTVLPIELARTDPAAFAAPLARALDLDPGPVERAIADAPAANVSPGRLGIRYQRFARRVRLARGRRATGDPRWEDPLALGELVHGRHGRVMSMLARVDRPPTRPRTATSAELASYFAPSNRRTIERTGWPLETLGYAV